MDWLGYSDAVSSLNEVKTRNSSLQPILKFSKPTCILSACQPACHKTVALGAGLLKFHMMAADL